MRKIVRNVIVLGVGLLIVPFLTDLQRPFSTVESGIAYAKGGGGGGGSRGGGGFGSNRGGSGSFNSGQGSSNSGPGSVNSGRGREGEAPRGIEVEIERAQDARGGGEPEARGRAAEGEASRGLDPR